MGANDMKLQQLVDEAVMHFCAFQCRMEAIKQVEDPANKSARIAFIESFYGGDHSTVEETANAILESIQSSVRIKLLPISRPPKSNT